jgi:hypothetical protein
MSTVFVLDLQRALWPYCAHDTLPVRQGSLVKTAGNKVRVQTTLSQLALERARRLMDEVYGMTDLNELIDRLITEEYERRHGKILLEDSQNSGPLLKEAVPKRKKKVA